MMLHNNKAGNIMERMKKLADAGIELHLQVVLCKGVNDGERLDKTIEDVTTLFPQARSMSVVPVGLTKYREGLYKQEPFTKEDAALVLDQIEGWQRRNLEKFGSRIVYAADEFYLKAERDIPEPECYEDFQQFENGVGMLSLFKSEFYELLPRIEDRERRRRKISLATGYAAYDLIKLTADEIMKKCPELEIDVQSFDIPRLVSVYPDRAGVRWWTKAWFNNREEGEQSVEIDRNNAIRFIQNQIEKDEWLEEFFPKQMEIYHHAIEQTKEQLLNQLNY